MTSSRWTCNWLLPEAWPARSCRSLLVGICFGSAALLPGCADKADSAVKAVVFRPTPGRAVLYALQEENPDTRRRYLLAIINRKELTQDWCIKSLDVIARTDADAQVRCLALRALGKSGRVEAIDTALAVLNPKITTKPVRMGEDDVRFDALVLLEQRLHDKRVPDNRMESVRQAMLKAAADEQNLQARMVGVRALRYFPGPETLALLVNTLRENNFGLMFEAEMSLRALTGHIGDYEADSWQKWLAGRQDPFAGHSAYVEMVRSSDTVWRRTSDAMNEFWSSWQGASKPTAKPSPTAAVKQAEGQRMMQEAAQ